MARISNEDWIKRFRSKHGDLYEYIEFWTKGKNRYVKIQCKWHGEFVKQVSNHWNGSRTTGKGGGCPECSSEIVYEQSNRYSRSEWIEKFTKSQPMRYDYTKTDFLVGSPTIFLCEDHGEFKQTRGDHALGRVACLGCRLTIAKNDFLENSKKIFGDVYDYSKFEYVNAKTKSTIVCPIHGDFEQNPDKHLNCKYPCPTCNNEARLGRHREGGGWYNKTNFSRSTELSEKPATVYYLEVDGLYKIGITTNHINRRLSGLKYSSGLTPKVLDLYECTAFEAYILEQNILIKYGEHRTWTKWTTEIFRCNVLEGQKLEDYQVDDSIYDKII